MVKSEVFTMINEQLHRPSENATLVILAHLLDGEAWSCDEETIRTLEQGLGISTAQSGGSQNPEDKMVNNFATS